MDGCRASAASERHQGRRVCLGEGNQPSLPQTHAGDRIGAKAAGIEHYAGCRAH